jgi:hypothetical protein
MKRVPSVELLNGPSDPQNPLSFRNVRHAGGRGKRNADSFETGASFGSAWALFSRETSDGSGTELPDGVLLRERITKQAIII